MKEEDYQNDEQQNEADADAEDKDCIEDFNDDPNQMAQASESESPDKSHLYHCSECNINFPSIQKHIDECHKDQEVVFQVCLLTNRFCFLIMRFQFNLCAGHR